MARQRRHVVAAVALAGLVAAGCGYDSKGSAYDPNPPVNAQVVTASGDLTAGLAQFRGLLGDTANRDAGEQPGGRREINWDGVGGALLNANTFPGDQFNRVVPRGQIFSTPGTGFRVSDNAYFDLEASDSTQFRAFSPQKLFVSIGSPLMTVNFRVAGSDTRAATRGFGVVFSDVDVQGSASLEFFSAAGVSLKKVIAPVRSDATGHSFAGAVFDEAIVASVVITAGQAAVGVSVKDISAGGTADLVATDDFIAGEPHPIP